MVLIRNITAFKRMVEPRKVKPKNLRAIQDAKGLISMVLLIQKN